MRENAVRIRDRLLATVEGEDYRGHSKFDALASPLVRASCLGIPFLRLAASVVVSRAPVDLRGPLLVPKRFSTKAATLLARAYLRRGAAGDSTKAGELLDRLDAVACRTRHGVGLGYDHPWQGLYFYAPAYHPNAYLSSLWAEALLNAGRRARAEEVAEFLRWDLPVLLDEPGRLAVAYVPGKVRACVVNVNAFVMAILARTGDDARARRLAGFVLSAQRPDGAWHYTDPPGRTGVDNYHTGFILDSLATYADATHDTAVRESYRRGLEFYRSRLFETNGAPRWREERGLPHDIQGAAQGILTFTRARDFETADRILAWTIERLWDEANGRFGTQATAQGVNWMSLLGWSNDLIALALAERLAAERAKG